MLLRAALSAVVAAATFAANAAYTDEPLEPEQAFPVRANVVVRRDGAAKAIELRFAIARGYYLYRDRFRIEAPGLDVAPPRIPAGIAKDDPFVGKSRILKHSATLGVPFKTAPAPGEYTVTVTSQGCAEDRVCYAPFAQTVRVRIP